MDETRPLLEENTENTFSKKTDYSASAENDNSNNGDGKVQIQSDPYQGYVIIKESTQKRGPQDQLTDKTEDMVTKVGMNAKFIYFILMLFSVLNTYALILYLLVISQYGNYYIQRDLFPSYRELNESSSSTCSTNKTSVSFQQHAKVQQENARFLMLLSVADKSTSMVASYIVGSLSDRYGRKPVLLYIFCMEFLAYFGYFVLIYFKVNINYFFIISVLGGIGGGFYGALSVSFALVADLTKSNKDRTLMITVLELSLGVGGAISGISSGYLIRSMGFAYSMAVAVGIVFLVFFIIYVFLIEPSCRTVHRRSTLCWNLRNAIAFYTKDSSASVSKWQYILCISSFMTACLAFLSKDGIDVLYQMNTPFCWSSVKIGWYSSAGTFSTNFIGIVVVKMFQMCTNMREEVIGILSSISGALSCLLAALSYKDVMLFFVPAVGTLSMLAIPMLRSIMSKMTPSDMQGSVFASIAVVENFSILVGDVGSKSIYIATVAVYRGLIYFVFCACNVTTTVLFIVIIRSRAKTQNQVQQYRNVSCQ